MRQTPKTLIVFLVTTAGVLASVIFKNTLNAIKPQEPVAIVDMDKLYSGFERAGIVPREALHWKEL